MSSALAEFVTTRSYLRWRPEDGRREDWNEAAERYFDYLAGRAALPAPVAEAALAAVQAKGVLPSMRGLWGAGPALDRCNVGLFNCTFLPIDCIPAFAELLYILMQGTGAGFSVERQFVDRLPVVGAAAPQAPLEVLVALRATGTLVGPLDAPTVVVLDTTEGWADAYRAVLTLGFLGQFPSVDYSPVRREGAILETKGGRASGPEPLRRLLDFVQATLRGAMGRQLYTVEAHDICCMSGEIVMAGGVRRAALISISDPDDELMRHAKDWSVDPEPRWRRWARRALDLASSVPGLRWLARFALTKPTAFPECRYMANNSAFYSERPTRAAFDVEWAALVASGSGERGILHTPEAAVQERGGEYRTNPCGEIRLRFARSSCPWLGTGGGGQACVAGDTPLITKSGLVQIQDVVGQEVEVWNGLAWSKVTPRVTGHNRRLYRVKFSDGSYLDTTENHRFSVSNKNDRQWRATSVEDMLDEDLAHARAVEPYAPMTAGPSVEPPSQPYTLGVAVGDGVVRWNSGGGQYNPRTIIHLFGKKIELPVAGERGEVYPYGNGTGQRVFCPEVDALQVHAIKTDAEALNPVFNWPRKAALEFLAGWFDTDGSVTQTGGVRLYLNGEQRARRLQLLLTRHGIMSSVCLMSKKGTKTNMGVRNDDIWYLSVTDGRELPCHRLDVSKGHAPKFKSKYQTIRSIEPLPGLHTSYCFEESERHMAVFANVLTYQCNLSAAVLRSTDTWASGLEKVRLAAWIGAAQATFTQFSYLRPAWARLCVEDRLLGVDITGQCDAPHLATDPAWLDAARQVAEATADEAAAWYGINRPRAVTCGKPSGNSSQAVDCSSGFHTRWSPYYIRRVRIARTDPLFRLIRDRGVPVHKDTRFRDTPDDECPTWVAEFPVAAPPGARVRGSETALEMLERYALVMRTWCAAPRGHNQSVTIYVRPEEWAAVGEWVFEHFDLIGGLSFLPYDAGQYELAPYEEITAERYAELAAAMPDIDYVAELPAYEREDMGQGATEYACVGGACEVDYSALSATNDQS